MDYRFLLRSADGESRSPAQRRLYINLRQAISNGRLGPRHRLPSSRDLAEQLDIARNTVIYAYEQLGAEGYLSSSRRGTVVAALKSLSVRKSIPGQAIQLSNRPGRLPTPRDRSMDLRPFSSGLPAVDLFPFSTWRAAIQRAMREYHPRELSYGDPQGVCELRTAIGDRLRAVRGLLCSPDQVFVTDGTQIGLDLCARLLAAEHDVAWMESPGYAGARVAFDCAKLDVQFLEVDEDGMKVEELAKHPKPRLIYLTPSHQFPMGGVLSLPRRIELLRYARAHNVWILEDDYDSDFRYDGEPLPAMQGLVEDAPVIYLGTFSKTMFPGLRLGYLVVPEGLVAPLRAALSRLMRHGRQIEQLALTRFIADGHYARHLSRMRKLYRARQRVLRGALEKHLPQFKVLGVKTGLHMTLLLPAGTDDRKVCEKARTVGLNPQPLSEHFSASVNPQPGLVLGYGNTSETMMERAVRMLTGCIG